jgi:hypothetical protein
MSPTGHFETEFGRCIVAPSIGPLLHVHLAFVPNNAPGVARLFSGSPPAARREPLPTEGLSKSLRVFRLGEAGDHKLCAIPAHVTAVPPIGARQSRACFRCS